MSDVFITCCTFGVLILLLRCLPLAVSASLTVTAFRGGKKRRGRQKVNYLQCTKSHFVLRHICIKMYKIPVVASPGWGCSPLPEHPVCISLCRFLRPESPRCPHEQPWGPRFPFPLAPPRPGRLNWLFVTHLESSLWWIQREDKILNLIRESELYLWYVGNNVISHTTGIKRIL